MKASLPVNEPARLQTWDELKLYDKIVAKNQGKKRFTLHDGPPYANGSIHLGTALNKILKDIVVKFHNQKGELAEFIPGWDCHGLPIELQVIKELGKRYRELSTVEFRRHCRDYAQRFINQQKAEFKRLGVLAQWDDPYLTMAPSYQAQIVREFANVVEKKAVFRQKKPVYWCKRCETALAEAEVEYENHTSPSIYVQFLVADMPAASELGAFANLGVMIWTTTPWTLVANQAVALNADFDYAILSDGKQHYIVADKLVESVLAATQLHAKKIKTIAAEKLKGIKLHHPWAKRQVPIIFGEHVTLEGGTGAVHTAPGHGQEDYQVGQLYGLEVFAPVDGKGIFTADAGEFAGQEVIASNPAIIEKLKSVHALVASGLIEHSYPHCWRCKQPVIFRATEQWFIGMQQNDLRQKSLSALNHVTWIPKWGIDRIRGMLASRPDWCISRQRTWGVPIVTWECGQCGQHLLDAKRIRAVADYFEKDKFGADAWFETTTPAALLPQDKSCEHCGATAWKCGRDILDVWFDSGVSFAAVLENRLKLTQPCELYLEGSDQHRGWFHSSLLASLATRGHAPYQAVLTHGFVVAGDGRKMSKSLGNYVNALDMVEKQGAELLRLWVAAEDYQNDIRMSNEIMARLSEAYRRIRNTCRFLLGNLHDFNPNQQLLPYDELSEMDRYQLLRLHELIERCLKAYENYSFHQVYHAIHQFCVVDLSSFYLDVTKDCLYTNPVNSRERRSVQTVMFETVRALAQLLAPLLSFTADEVWQYLPNFTGKSESVHLSCLPKLEGRWAARHLSTTWENLLQIRTAVLKALENARASKVIGSSLQAQVTLCSAKWLPLLQQYEALLPTIFIVSQVTLQNKADGLVASELMPELSLAVAPAAGVKCERCWVYKNDVGQSAQHPTVCGRCVAALA